MLRREPVWGDPLKQPVRVYMFTRAPGWEGVRDGTGPAAAPCADCVPISAAGARYDAKIRR